MYYEIFQQFTEFNNNLTKPLAQLQSLTAQAAEKITRQQLSTASELFNLSVKHMQNLATVKKPEDMLSLQSSYINESANKCMENANQFFNATLQISNECSKWVNDGFKTFAEEIAREKGKAA